MAQELRGCEAHGTPTRLTCAECGTPICPACLVKTSVGLKCEEHAQAVAARFDRRVAPFALGALVLVAAAVVILAVAVLNQENDRSASDSTPAPAAADGQPAPGRIVPAQVFVMNADGSSPRTLTNRPLAFDASPAWSPDGGRIAFESTVAGKRAIWTMRSDGQGARRLTDGPGADTSPAWSPDGGRIAFASDRDGDQDVYVVGADGSGLMRLTDDPAADGFPAWSPDGGRLAFVSDRDGQTGIWAMSDDGSGPIRLVPGSAASARPSWAPEGRAIAFASDRDGGNLDIFTASGSTAPTAAPPVVTRLISSPGLDGEPAWSPDGARIAFASDRDGTPQVYVANRDGGGVARLTSTPRSFTPAWAPDGRRLLYIYDPAPGG